MGNRENRDGEGIYYTMIKDKANIHLCPPNGRIKLTILRHAIFDIGYECARDLPRRKKRAENR